MLGNKELQKKSSQERRLDYETSISSLPDLLPLNTEFPPTLFLASEPGPANTFSPIARFLSNRHVPVYFLARDKAQEIFRSEFSNSQRLTELPTSLGWIVTTVDSPMEFTSNHLKTLCSANPSAKLCIISAGPFSLTPLFREILAFNKVPDLILTSSRFQSIETSEFWQDKRQLGENTKSPVIIPIGNADFDELSSMSGVSREQTLLTREKLHIDQNTKVVTYIGIPAKDFPHVTDENLPFTDLNSLTLETIIQTLFQVAAANPNQLFCLINRPHPRESNWRHSIIDSSLKLPNNLKVINMDKNEWPEGITTSDVWQISDLVTTTMSTVLQQVVLAGGKGNCSDNIEVPMPMYVHLSPYSNGLIPEEALYMIRIGAAIQAHKDDLYEHIMECLFNKNYRDKIHLSQKKAVVDSRFKVKAVYRAYLWMKNVALRGQS